MKLKKYGLLFFVIFMSTGLRSQIDFIHSINTSGTYFNTPSINLSSSIGQVFSINLQNGNQLLTQGFQQTYFENTFIDKITLNKESNILIYPNPNSGLLNLDLNLKDDGYLDLKIINLQSQIVYQNQTNFYQNQSHFNYLLDGLNPGLYTVLVSYTNTKNETNTFKSVKLILQ